MAKSSAFYICFQTDIQDTKVQDELESQTSALAQRGIALIPIGAVEMSRRLKPRPEIVDDFFGRDWTIEFCGPDAARELRSRLNAGDVVRIRQELITLYSSNFSSIDPGIASALPSGNQQQLPLLSRFIEPDVTFDDASSTFTDHPLRPDRDEEREVASAIVSGQSAQRESPRRPIVASTVRRPLANWLTEVEQAAIIAAAGYGKSSFLRALALDLLSDGKLFPDLTKRWGDRIPIVLPFAYWTRLISNGAEDFSLADAIYSFFRRFNLSEDLLSLIIDSLKDNRLLLLIDGLDEWTNKDAARTALTLLDTFVKSHSINSVVTTRPGGVAKLGTLDPMWKCGNLAPLSNDQQRRLASIWFSHLKAVAGRDNDGRTGVAAVERDVENFFDDLNGRGMLMPLAGVPLLLSGLISLAVRNVVLPRNRFQAYNELIKLLLDEHPNRRAAASMPTAARSPILSDSALVRRVLSALAYHNRMNDVGASTTYVDAKNVVVEYLQSMDGAGLEPADAINAAIDLLTLDAETTGLLVQKAPDEIGFLHGVFEEYLAGFFSASLDIEAQKILIGHRIGDPKWTNVLLSMLHNLPRPSEVEILVRAALGTADDQSHAKLSRQLAAEVAFGDFRCPPKYAFELASDVFSTIETGPWPQERQALLSIVLDATTAGPLSETLKRKLATWMPETIRYRAQIYGQMAKWEADDQLINCLWQGLFNEDYADRIAAGRALVLSSKKNGKIADRLFDLVCSPIKAEIAASTLSVLFFGWPGYSGLESVIDQARNSHFPALEVAAIRCKIGEGTKKDEDLDTLLNLAAPTGFFYSSDRGEITQALVDGWPDSERLYKLAIQSAEQRGPNSELDREIAKTYLLVTTNRDTERDTKLAYVIRNDKYFFAHTGYVNVRYGNYGPEVKAAIDDHILKIEKFRTHEIAKLAAAAGSPVAKTRLFALLRDPEQSTSIYWPVWGLLTGWGMQDAEVREALEPLTQQPAEIIQYIAQYINDILDDKDKSRDILLGVARLTNLHRLDLLTKGLVAAGSDHTDEEVLESLLKHNFDGRGIGDATGELIRGFGRNPRVRLLALKQMQEIDAPWDSLAAAYGDDIEFRTIITSRLLSLPTELRSTIASKAGRSTDTDAALFKCVRQYASETDSTVRVLSVKSFCERIKSDDSTFASVLEQLRREFQTIGAHTDIARQAAITGLVELNRLDVFCELRESYDSKPPDVSLYFPENRALIGYLARNWKYIKSALGESPFSQLSKHSEHPWYDWDHFGPYVGESDALREDFLSYCASETKVLSSNGLEALSRIRPRSNLLLEHCLRSLDGKAPEDINSSPLDRERRALVVGQVFGHQFSHEGEIRKTLEERLCDDDSVSIVGLSLGWPTSQVLYDFYKPIHERGWTGQRVKLGPALHLSSVLGSTAEFAYVLEHMLAHCVGYVWEFLEFCVPQVVDRLKRDSELVSFCFKKLRDNPSGDQKASLPRLLVTSIGLNDELKGLCEDQYAEQCAKRRLSESGLDLTARQIRPVAHALLDVLVPYTF